MTIPLRSRSIDLTVRRILGVIVVFFIVILGLGGGDVTEG